MYSPFFISWFPNINNAHDNKRRKKTRSHHPLATALPPPCRRPCPSSFPSWTRRLRRETRGRSRTRRRLARGVPRPRAHSARARMTLATRASRVSRGAPPASRARRGGLRAPPRALAHAPLLALALALATGAGAARDAGATRVARGPPARASFPLRATPGSRDQGAGVVRLVWTPPLTPRVSPFPPAPRGEGEAEGGGGGGGTLGTPLPRASPPPSAFGASKTSPSRRPRGARTTSRSARA